MTFLALQSDSRGVTALLVESGKSVPSRLVGSATVSRETTAGAQAEALKAALPALRGTKPEVLVGLGPDEIRIRTLAVPPAPAEELPAIVAMQAAREASADAEQLVVDFLASPSDAEALVGWAEAATVEWWRVVATRLGGKLTVATPRPLATALLAGGVSERASLVATRAGDDLDFVATEEALPLLVRSARAPRENASAVRRELRRTLLSLPESEEGARSAQLFGEYAASESDAAPIDWQTVASKLGADDAAHALIQNAASAVGLALAAAEGVTPLLNLADPRRAPVAETGRRRQTLLAVATAAIVAAGGWMAYERVATLDRQIAEKQAEINAAQDDVEAFEPFRDRVAALDTWRQSDVTWLDEIERLGRKLRPELLDSENFTAESDLRVTQLASTAFVGGDQSGGRIDLTALARSSSTSELESRLRDELHAVEPISTAETPAKDAYRYKYSVLLRSPAAVDVQIEEREIEDPPAADSEPAAEGSP